MSILAVTLIEPWSNPLERAVWRQGIEYDCSSSLVYFLILDAESWFLLAALRIARWRIPEWCCGVVGRMWRGETWMLFRNDLEVRRKVLGIGQCLEARYVPPGALSWALATSGRSEKQLHQVRGFSHQHSPATGFGLNKWLRGAGSSALP